MKVVTMMTISIALYTFATVIPLDAYLEIIARAVFCLWLGGITYLASQWR